MHFDQTHARLLKKFQTQPDSLYIRAWTEISVFIVKYWRNVLFVIHTVIVFDWTLLVPWSILHGKFASTSNLIQRLGEEYANYFRINFKGLFCVLIRIDIRLACSQGSEKKLSSIHVSLHLLCLRLHDLLQLGGLWSFVGDIFRLVCGV